VTTSTTPTTELIFEAMESRAWDRDELARRMRVPRSVLDSILSGHRPINAPVARLLVAAFGERTPEFWTNHYDNYQADLKAGKRAS